MKYKVLVAAVVACSSVMAVSTLVNDNAVPVVNGYVNTEVPGSASYDKLQHVIDAAALDLSKAGFSWAGMPTVPVSLFDQTASGAGVNVGLTTEYNIGTNGKFVMQARIKIALTVDPVSTLLHETGHSWSADLHGMVVPDVIVKDAAASDNGKLLQHYKLVPTQSADNEAWLDYATGPQETWARAFAEFVAIKADDKTAITEMTAPGLTTSIDQWSVNDFKTSGLYAAVETEITKAG